MALPLYDLINNINKQLKNICCKIEQGGGGGGSSTNIYNSDGTLTGNRTLSGANNDLTFADLNVLKTSVGGNDIGLNLNFSNSVYQLGDLSIGYAFLCDIANQNFIIGDYAQNGNTIEYNLSTGIITTNFGFSNNGLRFEMSNSIYQLGQLTGGNQTYLQIDDAAEYAYFDNNNDGGNGLFLDYATKRFYFGEFTGGANNTHIKIDDAAAYPVEISGANVSTNTAGAASGQYLKVKVAGTDYKIALLNP
jgi:hypothetical protein